MQGPCTVERIGTIGSPPETWNESGRDDVQLPLTEADFVSGVSDRDERVQAEPDGVLDRRRGQGPQVHHPVRGAAIVLERGEQLRSILDVAGADPVAVGLRGERGARPDQRHVPAGRAPAAGLERPGDGVGVSGAGDDPLLAGLGHRRARCALAPHADVEPLVLGEQRLRLVLVVPRLRVGLTGADGAEGVGTPAGIDSGGVGEKLRGGVRRAVNPW